MTRYAGSGGQWWETGDRRSEKMDSRGAFSQWADLYWPKRHACKKMFQAIKFWGISISCWRGRSKTRVGFRGRTRRLSFSSWLTFTSLHTYMPLQFDMVVTVISILYLQLSFDPFAAAGYFDNSVWRVQWSTTRLTAIYIAFWLAHIGEWGLPGVSDIPTLPKLSTGLIAVNYVFLSYLTLFLISQVE